MSKKIFLILPSLAVLLLAGCITVNTGPQSSSPTSGSSPSASPSDSTAVAPESFASGAPDNQCLTENLAISVDDVDSAAGSLHSQVVFTNNGDPCVLEGFPDVQVTSSGTPMGASSDENSSVTAAPVAIAHGASAVARLTQAIIDPGGGPLGDACVVGHGDGYNITPPHSLQPILVAVADVPACTTGPPWMTVGPVTGG